MKEKIENDKSWLTSKEVEKELKISSCELSHLRQKGTMNFIKKGNSFFYDKKAIQNVSNKKSNKTEKI